MSGRVSVNDVARSQGPPIAPQVAQPQNAPPFHSARLRGGVDRFRDQAKIAACLISSSCPFLRLFMRLFRDEDSVWTSKAISVLKELSVFLLIRYFIIQFCQDKIILGKLLAARGMLLEIVNVK